MHHPLITITDLAKLTLKEVLELEARLRDILANDPALTETDRANISGSLQGIAVMTQMRLSLGYV
jgi:hypothetical protein